MTAPSSTDTPAHSGAQDREGRRARVLGILDRNFIWALLALLAIAASIRSPAFATTGNLFNILAAAAPLGMLVLAQSIVLIGGNFDLSTEAIMIFAAVLSGRLLVQSDLAWPLVVALMIACAMVIGSLNGLMIVKLRMNAFMVTLGMAVTLSGLTLIVGRAEQMLEFPEGFRYVGSATWGKLPVAAVFLAIIYVIAHLVLTRTVFGRSLFAVGSNRRAARAAGIPDDRIVILSYVLSGALSGIAAFLLVGRLGVATAGISNGALFASIAAAVVGGVSLLGGRGTVVGMLGGLLLMSSITNALNLTSVPVELISFITGLVILLAIFIDSIRERRRPAV